MASPVREVAGQDFPFETFVRCAKRNKNGCTTDIATENGKQCIELPTSHIHDSKMLLQLDTKDHEVIMVADGSAKTSLYHVTTETDIDTTAELLPSGGSQSHHHATRSAVSETLPPQPKHAVCPIKFNDNLIENSSNKHPQGKPTASTTQPFCFGISADKQKKIPISVIVEKGSKFVTSEDENFTNWEYNIEHLETSTSQNLRLTFVDFQKINLSNDLTEIKSIDMKEPNQEISDQPNRMESTVNPAEPCNKIPKDQLDIGESESPVIDTTDLYNDVLDTSLTSKTETDEQFEGYSQCLSDLSQTMSVDRFTDLGFPEEKKILLLKYTEWQVFHSNINMYTDQNLDGHSSAETTENYRHIDMDHKNSSVNHRNVDIDHQADGLCAEVNQSEEEIYCFKPKRQESHFGYNNVNDKKEQKINTGNNGINFTDPKTCSKETDKRPETIMMVEHRGINNSLFGQDTPTSPECCTSKAGDVTLLSSFKTLLHDSNVDSNINRSKLSNQLTPEACSSKEVLSSSFKDTEEQAYICYKKAVVDSIGLIGGNKMDNKVPDGKTRMLFTSLSLEPDTYHTKMQNKLPDSRVACVCGNGFQNEVDGTRYVSEDRHVRQPHIVIAKLSSSTSQPGTNTSSGSQSIFSESRNERCDCDVTLHNCINIFQQEDIDPYAKTLLDELHEEIEPPDGQLIQVSLNSKITDAMQYMDHENGITLNEEQITKTVSSHNIMSETGEIKLLKENPQNNITHDIALYTESNSGNKDSIRSSVETDNGNHLIFNAEFENITPDPNFLYTDSIISSGNSVHQCMSSNSHPSYLCTTNSPDPPYQCTTNCSDPSCLCTITSPDPSYQCTTTSPDSLYQGTTSSSDPSYQYTTTSCDSLYQGTTSFSDPSYQCTTTPADSLYQYTTTSADPSYQCITTSACSTDQFQCITTSSDPSYQCTITSADPSYQCTTTSADPSNQCITTSADPSYQCTTTSPDPSYQCTITSADPSYQCTTTSADPSNQCITTSADPSYQCTTTSPDPSYQCTITSADPSYQCKTTSADPSNQCITADPSYQCTTTTAYPSYQCTAPSADPSNQCITTSADPSYQCTTTSADPSYQCTTTSADPSYQCTTTSADPSNQCITTSADPSYQCTTTSPDPSYQCTTTSANPSYQCATTFPDSSYHCKTISTDLSYHSTATYPDLSYQCTGTSADLIYQNTTISPDPNYQCIATTPDIPDSCYQRTSSSTELFNQCTTTFPDAQLIAIVNEAREIHHMTLQSSVKAPTQDEYGNIIKQNEHYFLEELRKIFLDQQGKGLTLLDSGIVLTRTVNHLGENITLVTLWDGSELGMTIPSSKLFLYYHLEKHFVTEQLNEDWYFAQDRITKVNMLMKKGIFFDPSSLCNNDDLCELRKCLRDAFLCFLCNGQQQELDWHSEVLLERACQVLEEDCLAQINPTSHFFSSQPRPVPFCLPYFPNENEASE
ncbi:uncharacterized protein LOC135057399 [Pseudophryne corroboree]|uniref:uncharacterized protein LOC135057399 n=1 Tax=Pseudophryne corroboree TaxID=495146 RepID=UPI003081A8BE